MPDHVMRHPWSTPGHPLKAHQAAPNHVRWGIWGGITFAGFPVHNEILAHCERERSIDCHEATKAHVERYDTGRAGPREGDPGLRSRLRVAAWSAVESQEVV